MSIIINVTEQISNYFIHFSKMIKKYLIYLIIDNLILIKTISLNIKMY